MGLLSINRAASVAMVRETVIRAAIRTGRLPWVRATNNRVQLIDERELQAWLERENPPRLRKLQSIRHNLPSLFVK